MSAETWLDDNGRYLAASLHWLRLRLQSLALGPAPAAPAPASVAAPPAPAAAGWLDRWRSVPASPTSTPVSPAAPVAAPGPAPEALDQASAARAAAAAVDPPPALLMLADRLGLSAFERDTLLLCAACDLDPALAALCAEVPGHAARAHPSFALALQALAEPAWDALSPHRPLRYLRLLEINQPGATPLTAAALRADERIVHFIKGLNEPDERLTALLAPLPAPQADLLAPTQQAQAKALEANIRGLALTGPVPVVHLLGSDAGSKQALAATVAAGLNRRLYRIAADSLPAAQAELETLARLWQRESRLLPLALYIDAEDIDGSRPEALASLRWLQARELGLVLIGVREPMPQTGPETLAVDIARPSAQEQRDAWSVQLAASAGELDADATSTELAGQFHLNLGEIRGLATHAAVAGSEGPLGQRLWDACCALTRPRLDLLAQRIDAKASWGDLVLGPEAQSLLQQIAAQVRGRFRVYEDWGYARKMTRGLGISALFAGESGTGKTMAAEVLASELRLALYRIDLSAVVSKYIGETEKNLRRLFDAAEQGGAILFFDEADALFGKRSEVKDSHDRYANIEINYLLQRMEAYSGLAILATNMKSALDPAFMRRLRFIVDFGFPGVAERKLIWQRALAAAVPRESLDYERLAHLPLSGGNIHSIALNAAFAAAGLSGGTAAVTMPMLLAATAVEMRKLGKPTAAGEPRVRHALGSVA